MAKKEEQPRIPNWSIHVKKGIPYFRIQTYDADGRRFDIYGRSEQEVKQKYLQAQQEIEDAKFRKLNPTVREYSEKWLEMHSALIRPSTLKGYSLAVHKYIINPLGDMYMSDVTADDIKLAMVPVSKRSSSTYNLVNMLFKSIFYSAEYSNLIRDNPTAKINAKGGVPKKDKEAPGEAPSGHDPESSPVCLCYDRTVLRAAARGNSGLAMGLRVSGCGDSLSCGSQSLAL